MFWYVSHSSKREINSIACCELSESLLPFYFHRVVLYTADKRKLEQSLISRVVLAVVELSENEAIFVYIFAELCTLGITKATPD